MLMPDNMLPPTSQLPPIKSIELSSTETLQSSVEYLWKIYNPPVRGSRRQNRQQLWPQEIQDIHHLFTDAFERDYAIRWLTALISHCGFATDDSWSFHDGTETVPSHEKLIGRAASLLAICAGTASAGVITRTFMFNTAYPKQDKNTKSSSEACVVAVELKDVPFDNHDYRSVGAQTWGSACIMADMIAENPTSFGLPRLHPLNMADGTNQTSFRFLELGAGTGLVSLTVGKLLEMQLSFLTGSSSGLNFEIVSTDYYSTVLQNLETNIRTNFVDNPILHIYSHSLDWSRFSTSSHPPVLQKPFDVIYGADIVYEAQHAEWIKSCIEKLLKKPDSTSEDPAFHLIIPLRKTHIAESSTIQQMFRSQSEVRNDFHAASELVIKYKETLVCDSHMGGVEEVKYTYYKIGWAI